MSDRVWSDQIAAIGAPMQVDEQLERVKEKLGRYRRWIRRARRRAMDPFGLGKSERGREMRYFGDDFEEKERKRKRRERQRREKKREVKEKVVVEKKERREVDVEEFDLARFRRAYHAATRRTEEKRGVVFDEYDEDASSGGGEFVDWFGEGRKRAKTRTRRERDENARDADVSKNGSRGRTRKREDREEGTRGHGKRRKREDREEETRGRGKRRQRDGDGEEETRGRGKRRQNEGRRKQKRGESGDTSSSDELDWDALKNARFYTPSPSETSELASDEEASVEEREDAPRVSALRDPETPAKGLSVTFNITPKQEVSEKQTGQGRDSVTEIAASLDNSESFLEEEEEEEARSSDSSDRFVSDTVDVSTKLTNGRSIVRLPNGVTLEVSSNSDIGIDFNADFPNTESSELEMHDSSIRVSTNLIDSL